MEALPSSEFEDILTWLQDRHQAREEAEAAAKLGITVDRARELEAEAAREAEEAKQSGAPVAGPLAAATGGTVARKRRKRKAERAPE